MNKRTYVLMIISFVLLITLGGIIWYGVSTVVGLKNEEATLRGELQSWVKMSKQTSSLQNTLNEAKIAKGMMDEYFFVPTEENQISLISDIERIIRQTGSTGEVQSIDVIPDFSKVVGSIIISGEWNNVYHSLSALEAYPIKLNFDDTNIVEDTTSVSEAKTKGIIKKPMYRASVKFTITNIRKPQ